MASEEQDSWLGRLLAVLGIVALTGPAIWIGLVARRPRTPPEPPPPPSRPTSRRLRIVDGPRLAPDAQGRPAIRWRTNVPAESFVSFGVADPGETVLGKDATLVVDHSVPLPDEPFSGLRRFHVSSVAEDGESVSAELGPGGGRPEVFRSAPANFDILKELALADAFAWLDLDADGCLDLAMCLTTEAGPALKTACVGWAGRPTAPQQLPLAGQAISVLAADFNMDGHTDLLVAGASLELFANRGAPDGAMDGRLARVSGPALGDSALVGAAAADLDGDGAPDVLVLLGDGSLRLYRNAEPSLFRFQPVSVRGAMGEGSPTALLACADFTGDGAVDILVAGAAPFMLVRAGDGWRPTEQAFPDDLPPIGPGASAAPGDWDGDGDLDIFLLSGGDAQVGALLRNDGTGRFRRVGAEQGVTAGAAGEVRCSAWVDLDSNGWLDLVLGTESGGLKVYLGADGRFMDATVLCRLPVPDNVVATSVSAVDLDGDGAPDLAIGIEGGSALLLQNRWWPEAPSGDAGHLSQRNLSE